MPIPAGVLREIRETLTALAEHGREIASAEAAARTVTADFGGGIDAKAIADAIREGDAAARDLTAVAAQALELVGQYKDDLDRLIAQGHAADVLASDLAGWAESYSAASGFFLGPGTIARATAGILKTAQPGSVAAGEAEAGDAGIIEEASRHLSRAGLGDLTTPQILAVCIIWLSLMALAVSVMVPTTHARAQDAATDIGLVCNALAITAAIAGARRR